MFAGLYLALNVNRLQSVSNIALDVNVQEILPAVQTSYFIVNILTRMVGRGNLSRDFQTFVSHMAANL